MMPAARCEPVLQTQRVGLLSVPFELLAAHWLIAQPNITRPEHRLIGEQIHLVLSVPDRDLGDRRVWGALYQR